MAVTGTNRMWPTGRCLSRAVALRTDVDALSHLQLRARSRAAEAVMPTPTAGTAAA